MKKPTRWLLSAALFLFCFLLLFMEISQIMRRKPGSIADRIHAFYSVEKDTLDVVVLGSSHAYYGFQPMELWDSEGITSYVLGSTMQSVASSYFLLKEAFHYQKPRVVLLESYYFYFDGLYRNEARIRDAFDGMKLGAVKKEMLDTFFPDMSLKDKLPFYVPFLMYHNRWDDLQAYDFLTSRYMKGSIYKRKKRRCKDPGLAKVKESKIPEVNLEYLDKIIALCEENGAKLVLYAAPFQLRKKNYAYRQGINVSLEKYLGKKGIPFLFYQKTGGPGIDFRRDFCDRGHLNWKGQRKLTRCIGEYLNESCGLEGHKNDPSFVSWEKDYRDYEKFIERPGETPEKDAE